MTPEERKMLNDLAAKVAQMPPAPRDAEAEDIIRTKIGSRPDALYLMTQTVLIQNLALQRVQQQIQDLQTRASQSLSAQGSPGWLGQSTPSYGSGGGQPQYSAPPSSQPQYAAPAPSFGGGSSFLRGAAQTAAGVAAGTLAAEAIGSMFSHHGSGFLGGGNEFIGGPGGGSDFIGGGTTPTEEGVNNYYDSPGGDSGYQGDDRGSNLADLGPSDDAAQYNDNSQFDDSNVDVDDSSGFDSGSDDSLV